MSAYATIDALRSQLGVRGTATTPPQHSAAYAAKMLHTVPAAPVVDRAGFLLDLCRGQRVLEFGASGPMHEKIKGVSAAYLGVDREAGDRVVAFDLDDVAQASLPAPDVVPEIIVGGEVLEHLSNPGWFLTRLRRQYAGITTVLSVPNAFTDVGHAHILKGVENVNRDHVAWYSYRTLFTLLERAGYTRNTFAWYTGKPLTAEGLIVVME